ncbi:MAG: carboxypeptidase-like regulatory domain-containing protein [Planctomycetota bacterium]|nr:carboxypeptidase-like regulatory domain-containing protein [Planctomycetota bacterium]
MKDFLGILRLAAYLLALPLIATAAASANQWASDTTPIVGPELLVAEGVETSTAPAPLPLQDHVVAKNDAGEVVGQVAIYDRSQLRTGLRNLTIYFVRGGKIVEETRTDPEGGFRVGELKDGHYTLIAAGESGFAVVGLNVVTGGDEEQGLFEVTAATPEFNTIKRTLTEFSGSETSQLSPSAVDPQAKSEVAASSRVWLTKDGKLEGRVISLNQVLSGSTSVAFIKDDKVVAKAVADQDGSFQVGGLEPGVYDVIATGPNGVSVVSLQAVPEGAVNGVYTSLGTFHTAAIAPTADLVLADVGDSNIVKKSIEFYTQIESGADVVSYDSSAMAVVADDMCMAAACGCSGGAGGAAGGGANGVGALAMVAAIAIPLAITSDNNQNNSSGGSSGGSPRTGGGDNPQSPSEP